MSHARYAITHTFPSWREKIPLEDTKPERAMRRILEELNVSFRSQDQADFTVEGIPIEIFGPHHERQTQRDHDLWKLNQLMGKLGYERVLWFWQDEVLYCREQVAAILRAYLEMAQLLRERRHRKEAHIK